MTLTVCVLCTLVSPFIIYDGTECVKQCFSINMIRAIRKMHLSLSGIFRVIQKCQLHVDNVLFSIKFGRALYSLMDHSDYS